MRSSNLNKKIEIQTSAETKNEFGEVEKGFSIFATVYASIVPLAGREFFASQSANAEITHKIECRYIDGVLPSMRVVYGTRIFNIVSSLNIREANKTLQIMATEKV